MNSQQHVKQFCEEHNMLSPTEFRTLDLVSEIGEVAKEILKMTNYGTKPLNKNNDIKLELGDAYFSLLALANTLDVDLEEALEQVLEKYNTRLKKGGAGSEND